jgi:small subunit ribosomal protein S2
MSVVSMKALLETGVHFGHRAKKWDPRMKPYIFTERNGIHIIDLQQTLTNLEETYEVAQRVVANGQKVLFVGTKRQAQETIQQEAERCGMPYVNQRWLGGTLTNWRTIRSRIEQMNDYERKRERGDYDNYTKKERLSLDREMEKMLIRLGGLRTMGRLPGLIFIIDVKREETAIHEANTLKIPVAAMVDTNCNPEGVDYVIPANDDAIRAIKLIASKLAEAVMAGTAERSKTVGDADESAETTRSSKYRDADDDETMMGPSTRSAMAKLRSDNAFGDDE